MSSHRQHTSARRGPLGRTVTAVLGVIALVVALAVTGSSAYADSGDDTGTPTGTPVVSVTKTLVTPGPFNPGSEFQYRIQYQCSSLETACPNAEITDVIPPEVSFVANTSTGDPSTITYDEASHQLKVVFTSLVDAAGTPGLIAGHSGQLLVSVKFPDGTSDGTVAHNCADMTADGAADAESCVDATAQTTPTYGVSLQKQYTSPNTGNGPTSGIQQSSATTTLDLASTVGGNQAASTVTVTDPGDSSTNVFDSFNLTGFSAFTASGLPAGIQAQVQVKSTGSYQTVGTYTSGQTVTLPGNSGIGAGDVTGVQVVYSCMSPAPSGSVCTSDGRIPANQSLDVKAGLQLRNNLRSDSSKPVPAGTVPNEALATATYPGAPDQTDTSTANYTVVTQSAQVQANKTIDPSNVIQGSSEPITMTVGGKNSGNVAGTSMTVTDPDPNKSPSAFDNFTFTGFNALANMPSGVTAEVKVLVGGTWQSVGTGMTNGHTPSLGQISAADVKGVQYIYSGPIAAGTTINNSFTTTLNSSVQAGTLNPANCDAVSLATPVGTGATQNGTCVPFTVTAVTSKISAAKSFKPASGTAGTDAATTVSISGTNGSNVPLSSFQLVEPGTGTGQYASDPIFNSFTFTGFGEIDAPSGTTWDIEVHDGTGWVALNNNPHRSGTTPPNSDLPDGIAADDVVGVRYTLANGGLHPIPAGATAISTTIGLQQKTTTAVGSVKNCVTAESTGITDANKCASYSFNSVAPGTGVGLAKKFSSDSAVQGSGATPTITLTGGNTDANVDSNSIVLEDSPATDSSDAAFWDAFTFDGFQAASRPTGTASLKVEYWDGSSWHDVNTYDGTGNVTPALPSGVNNSDVKGLRFTWTGDFLPKTKPTAEFKVSLNNSTAADTYRNCVDQTVSGPLIANPVGSPACADFTVLGQTFTVDQSKIFSPETGTVGLTPAATTTATLGVQNTGNQPLNQIVVEDPNPNPANPLSLTKPFDFFDLTGFGPVTLPSKVQVKIEVSSDGGSNYDPIGTYTNGQTVDTSGVDLSTVTSVRLTFSGTGKNTIPANQTTMMSVGVQLELRSTMRGTGGPVVPQQATATAINNCFGTTTTPVDVTLTGNACASYTAEAQSPGISAVKSWDPASGVREELPSSTITIGGRNSGNTPVDSLILQDPADATAPQPVAGTAFDAFDVTGLSGLVYPQGANQVQIDVLTADGTWHDGTPAASLPTGSSINGVDLGDIVGVRATFSNSSGSTLPVVTDATKTGDIGIDVTLRKTLRSSGKQIVVPPNGSVTVPNESSANVVFGGVPQTPATASADYTLNGGAAKAKPSKTLFPTNSPTTVNPNQTLIYQLQISNTGNRDLVAPVVLDKFDPTQLAYDPSQAYPAGSYQFEQNGSTLSGVGLTVDNQSASGALEFTFAPGDYLAPGQTAYLRVVMATKPGLPAGTTVTNTYGVTWEVATNGSVTCTSGASGNFDGDATWCTSSTTVKIQKAESMASVKWIQGDPERGFSNVADPTNRNCPVDGSTPSYTHYPCIAHTHDGGVFQYHLDMTVSGNVPIGQARAIDVLPHVGDTGVLLTQQQRGTQWTPTFISSVTVSGLPAGATYTLYYSDSYTPSTAPLTDPGNSTWAGWSTTDFGAQTKAIAIDVHTADGAPLLPAATVTLHWAMQAPPISPGVGSIAWNSFAFTGLPTDDSGWLLASEPRKVGIDLVNPSVQVQKTTSPTSENGTFDFTLTPVGDATGGGAQQLTTKDGTGSTTPWADLTPGGTYRLAEVPNSRWAPTFGQCTSTDAVTGVTTSITPTDSGANYVIFVVPDDGAVTCSFANAYIPPPPPETTTPPTTTTTPPTTSVQVSGTSSSVESVGPTSTESIQVLPTSETVQPSGTMAYTGFDMLRYVVLTLALLLGGAVLIAVGTLRRKPRRH